MTVDDPLAWSSHSTTTLSLLQHACDVMSSGLVSSQRDSYRALTAQITTELRVRSVIALPTKESHARDHLRSADGNRAVSDQDD